MKILFMLLWPMIDLLYLISHVIKLINKKYIFQQKFNKKYVFYVDCI